MHHRFLRITGFILIMVMLFSLVGCGSPSGINGNASDKTKSAEVKKEQEKKATSETEQNKSQNADSQASSQQNTAVESSTPSTSETVSSANTAQQPTASAVKSSTPAAAAQPSQSKTTTTITQQQTSTTSSSETSTVQVPVETVQLTIIGPKDRGMLMNRKTVDIKDGDTVLSVLLNGVKETNPKIVVDYSGTGATAYVRGIDNIYEFDYGPKSGWTVSQNGTRLTRSAGAIQVKAGDNIEWKYTEDFTVNN